jgi:hypothetical protein
MRIAVELEAYGATMSAIVADATRHWRDFTGNPEATLPHDTEISVQQHATHEYKGIVFARVRIETND